MTPDEFVASLVRDVPVLRPLLDEHLGWAPVIFFGNVALWAERQSADSDDLRVMLDRCESAYCGDNHLVRNVIQIGLIAGMAYNSWVYALVGPRMSMDAEQYIRQGRGVAGPRVTPEDFVRSVVEHVASLRPLLDEHLEDYEGELVAHAFFPDVALWADAKPLDSPDLRLLLDLCERAYEGLDERLHNVLYLSFLDFLEPDSPVLGVLGPDLATAAAHLKEHRG